MLVGSNCEWCGFSTTPVRTKPKSNSLFLKFSPVKYLPNVGNIHHSLVMSDDRSTASSKTIPPLNAI
jgi:hypothetical protein